MMTDLTIETAASGIANCYGDTPWFQCVGIGRTEQGLPCIILYAKTKPPRAFHDWAGHRVEVRIVGQVKPAKESYDG